MNLLLTLIITMKVLATIGNIQITTADLDSFVKLKAFEGYMDTSGDFRALEDLLTEKVLLLEAKERNIKVPDSVVENYFNLIFREYGNEREFLEFINSYGITKEEVKEKLRNDLMVFKLMEDEGIVDYEIGDSSYVKRPPEIRYRLIKISSPGYLPFYKKWLKKLKTWYVWLQIKLGLPFDEAARKYSEHRTSEIGGDMGVQVIEPHNKFIQIIASNPPGKVSKPFKTPYAYFIFKVEEYLPRIPVRFGDLNYHEKRVVLQELVYEKISAYARNLWKKFNVEIKR